MYVTGDKDKDKDMVRRPGRRRPGAAAGGKGEQDHWSWTKDNAWKDSVEALTTTCSRVMGGYVLRTLINDDI
jgi:hypothetical protein